MRYRPLQCTDEEVAARATQQIMNFRYAPGADLDNSAVGSFVRRWRTTFLEAMQPRYLQAHWGVAQRIAVSLPKDITKDHIHNDIII
jgi:hypothetical protein